MAGRGSEALEIRCQRVGCRRQEVDTAMLLECIGDAQPLPRPLCVGGFSAPDQRWRARRILADADQGRALVHQIFVGGVDPVPFEHRELGVMGHAVLAVAEDMRELPNARHPGDQQFLHREFGRGVQVTLCRSAVARVVQFGGKSPQMGFEPGAHLQRRRVDLDIAACGEEAADGAENPPALVEPHAPRRKPVGAPPFLHYPALVVANRPTYVSFYPALSPGFFL